MEEEEAPHDVVEAASLCKTFTPGGKFKIRQHRSSAEEGKSYVITSIEHTAHETQGYEAGLEGGTEYTNRFTCIPDKVVYRPARTTPKPRLQGVQTAVVVGPSGEEIYPDKYGRVKVQFHWDRYGKKDENSSCWIRVSQNWAGKEWGGMFIPHIGHEVVIDFLEGDPDRPLIVGRVYNAERPVPLPLPAEKTKSIIRDYGDNQMIWEGKPGKQHIRIEQECGNFLQMDGTPGQESVKLQDKFGNYLLMNSVDKTLSLYSPNHSSGMVLGKSVQTFSDSGYCKLSGGHAFEGFGGSKFTGSIGAKLDVFVGAQAGVAVGDKFAFYGGTNFDFAHGLKFNWSKASTYNITDGDAAVDSKKRAIIDADDAIILLGGDSDHSRVYADDNELTLQFHNGGQGRARPTFPLPPVIASTVGALTQITNAYVDEWQGRANGYAKTDVGKQMWAKASAEAMIPITVASTSASLVGTYMGVKAMKSASEARNSGVGKHSAPHAEIRLREVGIQLRSGPGRNSVVDVDQKSGNIRLSTKSESKGKIIVEGKQDVKIESETAIKYKSPLNKFEKGKVDHKNFKVLE
jgi:hypothetical protein